MANGNGLSPWEYGDPETTGAAQASMMMAPAVENYLNKVATGQIAAQGLRALDVPYDPSKSFAENALDPQRLQAAQNIAMGFSGGGLSFKAWHGTRADPFPAFSDEYIGTGQGHASYGRGHYFGEAQATGADYRKSLAGSGVVPLDDRGLPMNDYAATAKFYEPGTIVPSYGGSYDRVLDFNSNPSTGDFNVKVNEVRPDVNNARWDPNNMKAMINNPDMWKDTGPARWHSTFPSAYEMLQVGNARGWPMGDPGGLVKVNVNANKSDLLDWDLPWNDQEFDVKSKLIDQQLDPVSMDMGHRWMDEDAYPKEGEDLDLWNVPESYNVSGADLYHHIDSHVGDASELLDQAGVPGHKYLDQLSRGQSSEPMLSHDDNFETAPDPAIARMHLANTPTYGRTLDEELDSAQTFIKGLPDTEAGKSGQYGTPQQLQDLSNWIDKERAAGNFSLEDPRTHNFVIYNPKNIDIMTWNGIPLTPVEGTPPGLPDPPGEQQ